MAKILIVYYSKGGNTRRMSEYVAQGAKEEGGVEVLAKPVEEVRVEELLQAQGLIIGSPTYYGTMAWPVKRLLDESVRYHRQLEGRVGAAFTSSGNRAGGNETTVLDILKALLIHGMIIYGSSEGDHYGPAAVGAPDLEAQESCLRLGRRVAGLVKRLF